MTNLIETLHKAWYSLDAGTDRDEIRTRWPALAGTIGKLNRAVAIQYDAAAERVRKEHEEHSLVAELVLGKDSSRRGRYVEQFVKLGEDYLVLVKGGFSDPNGLMWTFVVNGEANHWYHRTQEEAILHLIAARHDKNPNSNGQAAFYAGRVLGVREEPEA